MEEAQLEHDLDLIHVIYDNGAFRLVFRHCSCALLFWDCAMRWVWMVAGHVMLRTCHKFWGLLSFLKAFFFSCPCADGVAFQVSDCAVIASCGTFASVRDVGKYTQSC